MASFVLLKYISSHTQCYSVQPAVESQVLYWEWNSAMNRCAIKLILMDSKAWPGKELPGNWQTSVCKALNVKLFHREHAQVSSCGIQMSSYLCPMCPSTLFGRPLCHRSHSSLPIPPSTLISLMASLEQAQCNLLITLLFVYFAVHSHYSVELICPN